MLQQSQSESRNTVDIIKRYTILCIILMLISFFPFFYMQKSLLTKDDGFLQHFVTIRALHNMLVQLFQGKGFAFWSWDIGLGADTIGALATVICDPFSYIAAIFPGKHIALGYTVSILIQMYVAGLAFLGFAKTIHLDATHILWGSLAYAFSSWVVMSVLHHNGFVTVAILFALLMMGVEKVLQKRSPVILILAAFASAITYFYFAYMSAIMIFLYIVIRYFTREPNKSWTHFLRYLLKFVVYVVIAAMLSLCIIIPVIYILHFASKSGAVTYSALFSLKVYLNYFTIFTSGKELFANYSCITVIPLFLIMLPVIFHRFRTHKATPAMIILMISFVMLLIPLCNSIMNGGSYPVGRWCYTTAFFFIWSGLECLQDPYVKSSDYHRNTTRFLVFLAFWNIVICKLLFNIISDSALLVSLWNLTCGFLFLQLVTKHSASMTQRNRKPAITFLICMNIILSYIIQFIPTSGNLVNNYISFREEYHKINTSTQKAATEIQDSDFYRVDQVDFITADQAPDGYTNKSYRPVHTPVNETLYWNTRSIYTYLSTTPDNLFTLYKNLCNSSGYYRRICTYGNDNRTRMDFLMGVKYFLGNNPQNSPSEGANHYASYGFHKTKTSSDGVDILKNKYSIGLGCTFQSYITESEWKTLSYADREQALMECVVLPDDTKTQLKHMSLSEIRSGAKSLSYQVVDTDNLQQTDHHSFEITKSNGSMEINVTESVSDVELYVYFKNLKRTVKTAKDTDSLSKSGYGPVDWINAIDYEDYGEFSVYCQKDTVEKKALNTNGTAQGFSDIEDYLINLGNYKKSNGKITISLDTTGTYTYDDFQIIAVPLETFTEEATKLQEQKLQLKTFSDDYVKGSITTTEPSMLYLSIPYNHGWKVYVDGTECKNVTTTDLAFTGIPLEDSGTHTIELRFKPVGFHVGMITFIIGALLTIGIGYSYFRKKQHKPNDH